VASGLRQRIVTALALAALVIGILFWMPPAAAVVAVVVVVLAGGWEWKNFTTELFVDNVTDERAEISRTVACSVCYNRTYAIIAPPRTVGVRFGSKF
jgi:outer membrane receptor protein involved in Fe transport